MKSVSGKKFAKLLYGKPENPQRISVPIHENKLLKTGLLRHFLKVSGISESEL